MKQLSTKSIASLLAATSGAIRDAGRRTEERHLDRILRRHDRKGELRAGILGITSLEFRGLQKKHSFDEIIKSRGFRGRREFWVALVGRLRAELLQRGWSRQRIEQFAYGV